MNLTIVEFILNWVWLKLSISAGIDVLYLVCYHVFLQKLEIGFCVSGVLSYNVYCLLI